MKRTFRYLSGVAVMAAAVALTPVVYGQAAVTETTTSEGTISDFSPEGNTVVVHREGSTEPMRYSYSKSTTIVDENGSPVDVSVVKSGVPVQVYYEREGDGMVARKIVVRHHGEGGVAEHRETTTTTTTSGGEVRDRDHDRDHDHDH